MFSSSLIGSNGVCEEVARSTPQSPLRSVVRAHLPNQQRTTVQVQPGRTLKEALAKALNFRKLSHDVCIVYRKNNPKVNEVLSVLNIEGVFDYSCCCMKWYCC